MNPSHFCGIVGKSYEKNRIETIYKDLLKLRYQANTLRRTKFTTSIKNRRGPQERPNRANNSGQLYDHRDPINLLRIYGKHWVFQVKQRSLNWNWIEFWISGGWGEIIDFFPEIWFYDFNLTAAMEVRYKHICMYI